MIHLTAADMRVKLAYRPNGQPVCEFDNTHVPFTGCLTQRLSLILFKLDCQYESLTIIMFPTPAFLLLHNH